MNESVRRLCGSQSPDCVSGLCTAQLDASWLAPNSQVLASTHLFRKPIPHVCVFSWLSGFRCPCISPAHHICAFRCAHAFCSHKSASWQRSHCSSIPVRRCSLAVIVWLGSTPPLQMVIIIGDATSSRQWAVAVAVSVLPAFILHNMLYLY